MNWRWISAACRGTSHLKTGDPVQDRLRSMVVRSAEKPIFVGVISDGAGSAEYGRQGASLICRALSISIRQHFAQSDRNPTDAEFSVWLGSIRDQIFAVAQKRGKSPRDFAATMVCVITDASETLVAHVGDGCAVIKAEGEDEWLAPSWPDHGEYASTTTFVTDEPSPKVRFSRHNGPIDCLVIFSDGLERLALNFETNEPFDRFFAAIARPLFESSADGRDHALSEALTEFLDSPRVNERTDDDKSLIVAAFK